MQRGSLSLQLINRLRDLVPIEAKLSQLLVLSRLANVVILLLCDALLQGIDQCDIALQYELKVVALLPMGVISHLSESFLSTLLPV